MDDWSPPQDTQRPNCPYLPGFAVDIQTHIPPAPFGSRLYGFGTRPDVDEKWLKSVTQTRLVLAYPPIETDPPSNPSTCQLAIIKSIAIGNARGAQLVLCSITPSAAVAEPFVAVAKIFDPLYYPFSLDLLNSPADVVWNADRDYSHEAAAYEHLHKIGQAGTSAPKYFGSWTFTLPIVDEGTMQKRPIRLLLIEYLDAPSMFSLYQKNTSGRDAEPNAFHYDTNYRLEVMARVLHNVMLQRHQGLDQRDLAPRNIIIVPSPYYGQITGPELPEPRVVLIDYNNAIVFEKTTYGRRPEQDLRLPRSPAELFWTEDLPEFSGWNPARWYEDCIWRQEWLLQRFGGSQMVLYAPHSRELRFTRQD